MRHSKWDREKGLKMILHKNQNNPEAIKKMILCRLKGNRIDVKSIGYNGTRISIKALCSHCGILASANKKIKGITRNEIH